MNLVEEVRVHQLIHGYRHGHEQLAGSIKLTPTDAELVLRLSDLSGTLPSAALFYPYLTIYPLPSERYHAVARTWLDTDAPRSGCVLTRTALISTDLWEKEEIDISSIISALSAPSRNMPGVRLEQLSISIERRNRIVPDIETAEVELFVGKYFGEGIRPIVWFRDHEPEDLLVSILRSLWPGLRKRFAACTLSLQPRSLPSGPFDILFAPSNAYSRFSKIPKENIVEARALSKAPLKSEPWVKRHAHVILGDELPLSIDLSDLEQALGSEPTAIRWLYVLNDLRSRAIESPTAALGMMDVIETLSPESGDRVELKSAVVRGAIDATDQLNDKGRSLAFLQLICERLTHPSFSRVDSVTLRTISERVKSEAERYTDEALATYEAFLTRVHNKSSAFEVYRNGIAGALTVLADEEPRRLRCLHEHDAAAADIISDHPDLAVAYLGAYRDDATQPSDDLERWLRASGSRVQWLSFAKALLPLLGTLAKKQLVGDILNQLSDSEIDALLASLSSKLLDREEIERAVRDYIASRAPLNLRKWVAAFDWLSESAVRIASSTYSFSLDGILSLLDDSSFSEVDRKRILAALLARVVENGTPQWLRNLSEERGEIVEAFWSSPCIDDLGANCILRRLALDLEVIAPGALHRASAPLRNLVGSPLFKDVSDLVIRSALVWSLRGELLNQVFEDLSATQEIADRIYELDASRITTILTKEVNKAPQAWHQAWSFIATAPKCFYRTRNVVTVSMIHHLCHQRREHWTDSESRNWQRILANAREFSDNRCYVRHCVQALDFGFRNTKYPLSGVVRTAFPTVYKVVSEGQSPYESELDCLGYYGWDRAKALRRSLIDAFYGSQWKRSDLAIAARDSFGLRKLFTRIRRKWRGSDYLEDMAVDLGREKTEEARVCRMELVGLLQHRDVYEPWD